MTFKNLSGALKKLGKAARKSVGLDKGCVILLTEAIETSQSHGNREQSGGCRGGGDGELLVTWHNRLSQEESVPGSDGDCSCWYCI